MLIPAQLGAAPLGCDRLNQHAGCEGLSVLKADVFEDAWDFAVFELLLKVDG